MCGEIAFVLRLRMLGYWAKAALCRFTSGSSVEDIKIKTEKNEEGVP